MENQITFSGLEAILKKAMKLSCFKTKDFANAANMSNSGIYAFMSSQNHISVEKGDLLINFLLENNPQALKIANNLYQNN